MDYPVGLLTIMDGVLRDEARQRRREQARAKAAGSRKVRRH
jgi:hypothetical protein